MAADTVTIDLPEPRYMLVDCKREGLPEVISINSALLAFPHIAIFPWCLRIRMFFHEVADNGMPTPEESKILFEVADELEDSMLGVRTKYGCPNALFLARSTWNEVRELYFMVHDPESADVALKGLLDSRKWSREWEYRMDHDPDWEEASFIFKLLAPNKPS